LIGDVVAEVVILSGQLECLGVFAGVAVGVLPAFTVADVVRHQHVTTLPCPGHAHVLQFAFGFGMMVTVAEQDAGHLDTELLRAVEVCGDDEVLPTLEDDVVHKEAVSLVGARDVDVDVLGHFRPLSERLAQRFHLGIAELFPVLLVLQAVPQFGELLVDCIAASLDVLGEHLRQ
jgi:hypothetical protein